MKARGRIHSYENFGTVDGPGIRFVVFMQGCPLRCLYCHNPDTWSMEEGTLATVEEVVREIMRYRSFYENGGVTLSGGEPLMQYEFVGELLTELKRLGFHTALDTSGAIPIGKSKGCIDAADMLLLDIKSYDSRTAALLTGQGLEKTFDTLDYCEKTKKQVWIRYVLLPGFTDVGLEALCEKIRQYSCIEKVELLPYHTTGRYKYKSMNLDYPLGETEPPGIDDIERAKKTIRSYGFLV